MKIDYFGNYLFIYPGNYIQFIKDIHKEIYFVNSNTYAGQSSLTRESQFLFKASYEKKTYLIFQKDISYEKKPNDLIQEVSEYLKVFISLNSIIFNIQIQISNIIFISKEKFVFKMKRAIKVRNFIFNPEKKPRNFKINKYEQLFNNTLGKIKVDKFLKDIIDILNELILSREAHYIETKITFLWNFLEHYTNLFSLDRQRNYLIDEKRFEDLKVKIKNQLNVYLDTKEDTSFIDLEMLSQEINRNLNNFNKKLKVPISRGDLKLFKEDIKKIVKNTIKEENILVEDYDLDQIKNLIINQINNFPGIIKLIKMMLEEINFPMESGDENLIDYFYMARNRLFHKSLKISEVLEKLKDLVSKSENKRIDSFSLNDLYSFKDKFERLILKIIYYNLGFPLDIDRQYSSHSFETLNYTDGITDTKPKFFTSRFEESLIKYKGEDRYKNIVWLIQKSQILYNQYVKKEQISGIYHTSDQPNNYYNVIIKFNTHFSGRFKTPSIRFSQTVQYFQFINFLMYDKYQLKSLMYFSTVAIDFITSEYIKHNAIFSFETNYLDFKFSNNLDDIIQDKIKIEALKKAINPLPLDFLKDKYFQEYFKLPPEYEKALMDLGEDEIKHSVIILSINDRRDITRLSRVLGIQDINFRKDNENIIMEYKISEEFKKYSFLMNFYNLKNKFITNPNDEYLHCLIFRDSTGFLFITNSVEYSKIYYLKELEIFRWIKEFSEESFKLQYYLWLFIKLKKGAVISQANFNKVHSDQFLGKIEMDFNSINETNQLIEAFRVVIQLFTKISTYPKLKNLTKIKEEIDNNKEKLIDPYLDKNLKGIDYLSLTLHIILYNFMTDENIMLDEDMQRLYSICKELKGKTINKNFIKRFFDFCYSYIKNHTIIELSEN